MRILRRTVPAALCALVCGALLVAAMVGPAAPSLRRLPLTILGVVALAIFAKPSRRLSVAALIPVGPVLDAFFLTPGREIYATEVVLLAALIGWAGRRALAAPPWPRLPLAIRLWLAFAVVGVLALGLGLTAATPDPSWLRGVRLLVLAAGVPLIILDGGDDRDSRSRLLIGWAGATLAGLLVMAGGGIAEYVFAIAGKADSEPGSFYRNSVGLAVHLAFFAPLGLAIWLGDSGRIWRLAGAIAWLASAACLPLTASRGAMGSVALTTFGLLAVTMRGGDRKRLRAPALALVVILAAAAVLAVRPELAGESFAYKWRATLAGDYFSTRWPDWREAAAAIGAHPLTGEGAGAGAPSIPLELARRLGLPAALLAMAALAYGSVTAGQVARGRGVRYGTGLASTSLAWGIAASLGGLLLVGLAETGLGNRATPLIAATLAAAALVVTQRQEV